MTGNSTMLYLYEGIAPSALAVVPFTMSTFFGSASRHTLAGAPVYLPRCIGAYVGADITCSILASNMLHENGVQLITDIRTVELSDNQVTYTTVGDRPAVGSCGSGILDALRVMLEQETIDDTGYLETEDEESYIIGDSTVAITQKDVRQIQLAKSAICAGLPRSCRRAALPPMKSHASTSRVVLAAASTMIRQPPSVCSRQP